MSLRNNYHRFINRNRHKGIPKLMLYISAGNILVYLCTVLFPEFPLFWWLRFDVMSILRGEVWRLFSHVFTYGTSAAGVSSFGFLRALLTIYCYYWVGNMLEGIWGTLRFNLYYLAGIVLMDVCAIGIYLIFSIPYMANASYVNLSMFLAIATLLPEQRVYFMYILPLKMRWLALLYFGFILYDVVELGYNAVLLWKFYSNPVVGIGWLCCALVPLASLLNYFLFMGRNIKNLLPPRLRRRKRGASHIEFHPNSGPRPNPDWAKNYRSSTGERPYHHKCTVCGRTDTDCPGLEFRYCSKCKGYFCYCIDHISDHTHIQ